jgi:hypothetical protein
MRPPFGAEEFFKVFTDYNYSIWPTQILLWALAFIAAMLINLGRKNSSRIAAWIIALFWAWSAAAYHFAHFSSINRAAWLFGAIFMVEVLLLIYYGGIKGRLRFSLQEGVRGVVGLLLILYALLIYPLASYLAGHRFIDSPTFGVPCPVTIYTIGMMFFLERPFPRIILAIPILWSVIGGSAAVFLGVPQDYGLMLAGFAAIILFASSKKTSGAVTGTDTAPNG